MTVPSCVRCGQLLLPEIVRELGDGRRCPFCGADLKPAAKVDSNKASPLRPLPSAPAARATRSAAAPTLPGMSSARVQSAAAVAVAPSIPRSPPTAPLAAVVAPSLPRSSIAPVAGLGAPSRLRSNTAPTMAFAPAPQPETGPKLPSAPPARPNEVEPVLGQRVDLAPVLGQRLDLAPLPSNAAPPWLAARRRRTWVAIPAVLALIVAIGLLAGRRPTAVIQRPSAPGPSVVPPRAAALPTVKPLPPAPPAEEQETPKDSGLSPSHRATGHAEDRAGKRAAHRIRHAKKRMAHPSRSKHKRVVGLVSAAAPTRAEDEGSARASYERGNQRLLSGDTAAAISAYQEAVRSAPSSPSGYRGLGLAYEKEGKIADAVRAFRKYLELAPSSDDRDLVARRVRHLLRSGRPGK